MKINVFLSCYLLILPSIAFAQEESTVDVYEAPKNLDITPPEYPRIEENEGVEGWVVVNYMVDTEGKVFEPTVVGSTGSKRFERAAIEAISESTFKPANLDGKPVVGSGYFRFSFIMNNEVAGTTASFASSYRRLTDAIRDGDKEKADKDFARIEKRFSLNHYERAYIDFAKASYAEYFGNKLGQMNHLRNALLFEGNYDDGKEFLPEDLTRLARTQLYVLEVENKHYADALGTFYRIYRNYGEDAVAPFKSSRQQILALKDDNTAYAIDSVLDDNGYFSIRLHKQGIAIREATGDINEFKLRCEKKYVFFAYEKGKEYKIPKSWGPCSLQVLGQANTTFQLVQF